MAIPTTYEECEELAQQLMSQNISASEIAGACEIKITAFGLDKATTQEARWKLFKEANEFTKTSHNNEKFAALHEFLMFSTTQEERWKVVKASSRESSLRNSALEELLENATENQERWRICREATEGMRQRILLVILENATSKEEVLRILQMATPWSEPQQKALGALFGYIGLTEEEMSNVALSLPCGSKDRRRAFRFLVKIQTSDSCSE